MNVNEIITLIKAIGESDIKHFEYDTSSESILISKSSINTLQNPVNEGPVETSQEKNTNQAEVSPVNKPEDLDPEVNEVTSGELMTVFAPIMGTFYKAPSPDADAFVKVGDRVKEGDTLCILEAMKMMNEITSDFDGEIVEVLVENEDLIEYNQALFKIKPL